MKPTKSSLWRSEKIELKTGVNILYWRAFLPPRSSAGMRQPVLIQSIDISGRYFTALCYIKGKGYTRLIWRLFVVNHHRRSAILPTPEGWKAELSGVVGYVVRQFSCPKAVTHLSTNRAQCRATALIETNALPLHQTANRFHQAASRSRRIHRKRAIAER